VAASRQRLFRFPFGACDERSIAAVAELGLLAVQWDVSSGDPWSGQKSLAMASSVLRQVRPGSIVLFHANGRGHHTGAAVPEIVRHLRAQGYEFVTVSELLSHGVPEYSEPRLSCYDSRPGDTDKYDALAVRLDAAYAAARQRVLGGMQSRAAGSAPKGPGPFVTTVTPGHPGDADEPELVEPPRRATPRPSP
jgi:hypothetical protein